MQCRAMPRRLALRIWQSTSGKCFSISTQHDKGFNWLVDRSVSSAVRHTLDLLNNALYVVWCNSKWKAIILANRFKKCLGEQVSCTFTDTISNVFFFLARFCFSAHYCAAWEFADTESLWGFLLFHHFTRFLDLAKEVNLILLDFWLSC